MKRERTDRSTPCKAKQDPTDAAQQGEQETLGEQVPNQKTARCSQCGPNGDFTAADSRAGQNDTGNIDASQY